MRNAAPTQVRELDAPQPLKRKFSFPSADALLDELSKPAPPPEVVAPRPPSAASGGETPPDPPVLRDTSLRFAPLGAREAPPARSALAELLDEPFLLEEKPAPRFGVPPAPKTEPPPRRSVPTQLEVHRPFADELPPVPRSERPRASTQREVREFDDTRTDHERPRISTQLEVEELDDTRTDYRRPRVSTQLEVRRPFDDAGLRDEHERPRVSTRSFEAAPRVEHERPRVSTQLEVQRPPISSRPPPPPSVPPMPRSDSEPPLAVQPDETAPFLLRQSVPAIFTIPIEVGALEVRRPERDLNVDWVLTTLETNGLFERRMGEAQTWVRRREARKTQAVGTRVGLWWLLLWILVIGAGVGGWFGWPEWVRYRHRHTVFLIERAKHYAYDGDHADLAAAERRLREVREIEPRNRNAANLLLFVHAQRALEDGAFDSTRLRTTIARGRRFGAERAYLDVARAIRAIDQGELARAQRLVERALAARPRDPVILYVAGRLEQRLDRDGALAHLQAAIAGEPRLIAARLALAGALYEDGRSEDARALVAQALRRDRHNLRARLWNAFLRTDTGENPSAALNALDALEEAAIERGGPTDVALAFLTRARLAHRQGAATEALDRAFAAGASEPYVLFLLAAEAMNTGRHGLGLAAQALRTALAAAPHEEAARALLAHILVELGDADRALPILDTLDSADPNVLELRARAALLIDAQDARNAALQELDAYLARNPDAGVELSALRLRLRVRSAPSPELLSQARALAASDADHPGAVLAVGEATLASGDARNARLVLQRAVSLAPERADAHYLLAIASQRVGIYGDTEAELYQTLAHAPYYVEAKLASGRIALLGGNYRDADAFFDPLTRSSVPRVRRAARIGQLETLIGRGHYERAAALLGGIPEHDEPEFRLITARVAIGNGQPDEALAALESQTTAMAHALAGDALVLAGRAEQANERYTAALAVDPRLLPALLGRAALHVRAGRTWEAIAALASAQRVLEREGSAGLPRSRFYLLRWRALLLARQHQQAEAAVRAAVYEVADPTAYVALGDDMARHHIPEARLAYERYLQLAPRGPEAERVRQALGDR